MSKSPTPAQKTHTRKREKPQPLTASMAWLFIEFYRRHLGGKQVTVIN